MQKRMIGVICGAAVVVLLAGSVVLLTRPSGKEDSSSDATAATTQSAEDLAALTLSDESADNVKQISVTNATGSYEVVRVKAEKTTTATDTTDSTSTSTTTETESAIFRISGWRIFPPTNPCLEHLPTTPPAYRLTSVWKNTQPTSTSSGWARMPHKSACSSMMERPCVPHRRQRFRCKLQLFRSGRQ